MASSGKKKTTMAKLSRESRLRERRLDKQARKNARKLAATNGSGDPQSSIAEVTHAEATLAEAMLAEEKLDDTTATPTDA